MTATWRILAALPQTRVLVVTTYETDADILRAVEAAAAAVLPADSQHRAQDQRGNQSRREHPRPQILSPHLPPAGVPPGEEAHLQARSEVCEGQAQ
ncbi:hypothetical protein I553_6961 [Mycobacterium xenopi 4042]|uniref:Uncharacterized protein n=1 Tax=Mycobacterium xenopi 4042 TaxID=1299334 RepID=X7Z324_MYCXE|nr:hypothetical protein I553_6961 [Mycobacterium xenopi 4042]